MNEERLQLNQDVLTIKRMLEVVPCSFNIFFRDPGSSTFNILWPFTTASTNHIFYASLPSIVCNGVSVHV